MNDTTVGSAQPRVYARDEHRVSRAEISDSALKVLYRLQSSGFEAYLVGGGVRDLLLDLHPKDFDIATNATPEEIHELFRNSRIIGRRFRLVHVRFGREIIEVSTFRGNETDTEHTSLDADGRLVRDNTWGSLDDDARRRDFTVNALYYTPEDYTILDYVDGMRDIQERCLRIIGDAEARYKEDPVRMLRAVRLAAKLGFEMDLETEQPIEALADRLEDIPAARLFDELSKLFLTGYAERCWDALCDSPLMFPLLPVVAESLDPQAQELITATMRNTDRRVAEGKPVTPGFLAAALLWPAVRQQLEFLEETTDLSPPERRDAAMLDVIDRQHERTSIPRRHAQFARETWSLQRRLEQQRKPEATAALPRFRAGWDLLELRAHAGEVEPDLVEFWRPLYEQAGVRRESDPEREGRRRRPRRRRRHGGSGAESGTDHER